MPLCSDAEIDIPDMTLIELIGLVKPIMTKELIKTAKVLWFVSEPFIIEQWHTGQKRKRAKM